MNIPSFQSTPFAWKQQYLYGSSRLGLVNMNKEIFSTECPNTVSTEFGIRLYELADHLGNVSAVFSENIEFREEKRTVSGSLQTTLYQTPQLISFTDYTPFGLNIDRVDDPALETEYRYGFNGKEQDDNREWGRLTHYDYGFRIYNPAIGKWLSVDPAANEYSSWSPYNYVKGNPIANIDPDGKRTYYFAGLGYNSNPGPYGTSINTAFNRYLEDDFIFMNNTTSAIDLDGLYVKNFGRRPIRVGKKGYPVVLSNYDAKEIIDIYATRAAMQIWDNMSNNQIDRSAGEKLNLVGTSMGSVTAAQTALFLLAKDENLVIDNLVLRGSPINKRSSLYKTILQRQEEGRIINVVYDKVQIPGDGITGCASGIGNCSGAAVWMGIKGAEHPHRAVAQSIFFRVVMAKLLLGELGIEGNKV